MLRFQDSLFEPYGKVISQEEELDAGLGAGRQSVVQHRHWRGREGVLHALFVCDLAAAESVQLAQSVFGETNCDEVHLEEPLALCFGIVQSLR